MSRVLWISPELSIRIVQTDEKDEEYGGLLLVVEESLGKDAMGVHQWVTLGTDAFGPLVRFVARLCCEPESIAELMRGNAAAVGVAGEDEPPKTEDEAVATPVGADQK